MSPSNSNRSDSPDVKPIRHAMNSWSVEGPIKQAPKRMMIREFLKNGLEAASRSASSDVPGRIVFDAVSIETSTSPTRKLRIWNTGPGMNAEELERVMDLHATGGGKMNGVGENFGLGAKLTGLACSPAGLRYRSCTNGVVSELILCQSGRDYGILRQRDSDGNSTLVVDRTADSKRDGRSVDADWTEVVLMGEDLEHDTTKEPFGKGIRESASWLAAAITSRFAEFPDFVTVEINQTLENSKKPSTRRLRGASYAIRQATEEGNRVEIDLGAGVRARFSILTQKGHHRYGLDGHIALVHKGELYDVKRGADWSRCASRFGVTYGQKQLVIHILLPDSGVFPDQNRQRLERDEPDRSVVEVTAWAKEISEKLPDVVRKHIDRNRPQETGASSNLQKRLKNLLAEYDWKQSLLKRDPDGTASSGGMTQRGDGKGGRRGKDGSATQTNTPGSEPASRTSTSRRGTLPDRDWVDGGRTGTDGHMVGRAVRYDRLIHQVQLNNDYEGLEVAVNRVVAAWPNAADQESLRKEALKCCREEFEFLACKTVMHAFMHEGSYAWSDAEIDHALEDHAMTLHLADIPAIALAVRTRLARGKWGKPIV